MKYVVLFAVLWLGLGSLFLWQYANIVEATGLNQYVAAAIGVVFLLGGLWGLAKLYNKHGG